MGAIATAVGGVFLHLFSKDFILKRFFKEVMAPTSLKCTGETTA